MKALAIFLFISLAIMTTCGCEFEDDKPESRDNTYRGVRIR